MSLWSIEYERVGNEIKISGFVISNSVFIEIEIKSSIYMLLVTFQNRDGNGIALCEMGQIPFSCIGIIGRIHRWIPWSEAACFGTRFCLGHTIPHRRFPI